ARSWLDLRFWIRLPVPAGPGPAPERLGQGQGAAGVVFAQLRAGPDLGDEPGPPAVAVLRLTGRGCLRLRVARRQRARCCLPRVAGGHGSASRSASSPAFHAAAASASREHSPAWPCSSSAGPATWPRSLIAWSQDRQVQVKDRPYRTAVSVWGLPAA